MKIYELFDVVFRLDKIILIDTVKTDHFRICLEGGHERVFKGREEELINERQDMIDALNKYVANHRI